jgi:hypothetical protein
MTATENEEAIVFSDEFVVSGSHSAEIFDLIEEAFDQSPVFVEHDSEARLRSGRTGDGST